jgi:ABC-2 type transport system ATP-binding protein
VESKKILECQYLTKTFGKKEVLHGVSLDLYEGDILGFIGPNGAGKTTTIKLILGLQSITTGRVLINGFDVRKDFVSAIEKVGAIVENPDVYMYLTGRQNLNMIARLYKGVTKERVEEVIKISGLGNRIDDKVSKYSLGMRQRLGIAASILHKPNVLILDEPTNGLDPEGIKELRNLLVKLSKEEHMGILISSHNLFELESFCNKVCIIQNGKVIDSEDINELKKQVSDSLFIFEVDKLEKITDTIGMQIEILNDNMFRIKTNREDIPGIVKKLVDSDYSIYQVTEFRVSLEEAFLSKTGGNKID